MKTLLGATLALCTFAAAADSTRLADPRLSYRSAFETTWTSDPPPADWRHSNELVRSLGGHAGHLRGSPRAGPAAGAPAGQAAPGAGAPAAASPVPPTVRPSGHPHHGNRP